ncbi:cytidine deaminase [Zhouia sp. PK063]|uniref:cytidine deaminase n=1 Tax=Zhouia sp. PK063 TaxID=3373602 RepID=UPI0037A0BD8D
MKKLEVKVEFTVFDDVDELTQEDKELMFKAVETRKTAYAPYSKFRVGAALLLENNEIVLGSNQENASYPSGLCAERVAIYQAGAQYPSQKIKKIAISAASDQNITVTPIPPCGACRQAIAEYEVKQESEIEIFFMGETGKVVKSNSLKDLMPLLFDKSFLL